MWQMHTDALLKTKSTQHYMQTVVSCWNPKVSRPLLSFCCSNSSSRSRSCCRCSCCSCWQLVVEHAKADSDTEQWVLQQSVSIAW